VAVFEYSNNRSRNLLELEGDRILIGKGSDADLIISDPSVSRRHAKVERIGVAWSLTDLDSKNGTLVNGKPLSGERVLRDGDEVIMGRTLLVYRDRRHLDDTSTARLKRPPALTPRERDVLIELCRPALEGAVFTVPASVQDIADALFIRDSGVKQHLARLYDKFDIPEEGREPRRVRLAKQAMVSGAVSRADLKRPPDG
jgi:DNA-binding CsgD family transcriptional regulator